MGAIVRPMLIRKERKDMLITTSIDGYKQMFGSRLQAIRSLTEVLVSSQSALLSRDAGALRQLTAQQNTLCGEIEFLDAEIRAVQDEIEPASLSEDVEISGGQTQYGVSGRAAGEGVQGPCGAASPSATFSERNDQRSKERVECVLLAVIVPITANGGGIGYGNMRFSHTTVELSIWPGRTSEAVETNTSPESEPSAGSVR